MYGTLAARSLSNSNGNAEGKTGGLEGSEIPDRLQECGYKIPREIH